MLTIFNLGDNEYKYNKITKYDFNMNEEGKEKIKFIYMKEYGRLEVRVGKIGEREVIQYIKFGGEN